MKKDDLVLLGVVIESTTPEEIVKLKPNGTTLYNKRFFSCSPERFSTPNTPAYRQLAEKMNTYDSFLKIPLIDGNTGEIFYQS